MLRLCLETKAFSLYFRVVKSFEMAHLPPAFCLNFKRLAKTTRANKLEIDLNGRLILKLLDDAYIPLCCLSRNQDRGFYGCIKTLRPGAHRRRLPTSSPVLNCIDFADRTFAAFCTRVGWLRRCESRAKGREASRLWRPGDSSDGNGPDVDGKTCGNRKPIIISSPFSCSISILLFTR